jgi:hypothetical protein
MVVLSNYYFAFVITFIFFILLFLLVIIKHFHEKPSFPIDIVYTWKGEEITNNMRTSNNNELKYSLRSIELYAPWVNNIYILMNPPKKYPSWIKKNDKIKIVDHKDTFSNNNDLPTTNSNSIETTIVNIKGLSEHYIYFNDDIFLGKTVSYKEFFTSDGKALVDKYTVETTSIIKDDRYNLLNIHFPLSVNRLHSHVPITQIKSLVINFNNKYKDYIDWIRDTKTRKMRGYDICHTFNLNTPCQQIHYPISKYMYSNGYAILKDNDSKENVQYIQSGSETLIENLNDVIIYKPKIFCINDTEIDPVKRVEVYNNLLLFFNTYYPNKASFEK